MIRSARKAMGLTQKQLADRIPRPTGGTIRPQDLNDVECDRRVLNSTDVLVEMARQLGLDADAVFLAAGVVPEDVRALAAANPPLAGTVFSAARLILSGHYEVTFTTPLCPPNPPPIEGEDP